MRAAFPISGRVVARVLWGCLWGAGEGSRRPGHALGWRGTGRDFVGGGRAAGCFFLLLLPAVPGASLDGFFVVDHDCRFLEVNEAFCRMTGYGESELLSMRISELEVPESPVAAGAVYARTGLHQFATAHRHKDGHIIHLEISLNVLHNDGAKMLVGFARDVTERRRTEEALALLTWQHRLILCCAAEGIAGLDSQGDVTFINPAGAAMLGASPGSLIGRPAHEVFLRQETQAGRCTRAECGLCAVLAEGRPAVRVEGEFVRADGTRFAAEFSLSSMRDGTRPIGAVIVFKDMSERRRAEEERRQMEAHIQQAQKLESLGFLAGGIAHDLNNMLVGILGNACLAQAQIGDDDAVRDRLSRVVGACERAAKVIRQILTYSGRVTCDAEPCELNALVKEMAEFMRAAVPKHIQLLIELEQEPATIEADSGQFQQMLIKGNSETVPELVSPGFFSASEPVSGPELGTETACPYCTRPGGESIGSEGVVLCAACGFVYPLPRTRQGLADRQTLALASVIAPGTVLRERYRLIELLGQGAHGLTFLAQHEFLSSPCVVKVLPYTVVDARLSVVGGGC